MSDITEPVKLAVFRCMEIGVLNGHETVGLVELYAHLGTYCRVSEIVEVTFEKLKDGAVIEDALRALDAAELRAREELQGKLDAIKDQRAQLLALTVKR